MTHKREQERRLREVGAQHLQGARERLPAVPYVPDVATIPPLGQNPPAYLCLCTQCSCTPPPGQNPPAYLRVAEVCSGIGGVEDGLRAFGRSSCVPFRVVVAVDGNRTTANAYMSVHPHLPVMCLPLADKAVRLSLMEQPHIMWVTAPCIDVSSARLRQAREAVCQGTLLPAVRCDASLQSAACLLLVTEFKGADADIAPLPASAYMCALCNFGFTRHGYSLRATVSITQ